MINKAKLNSLPLAAIALLSAGSLQAATFTFNLNGTTTLATTTGSTSATLTHNVATGVDIVVSLSAFVLNSGLDYTTSPGVSPGTFVNAGDGSLGHDALSTTGIVQNHFELSEGFTYSIALAGANAATWTLDSYGAQNTGTGAFVFFPTGGPVTLVSAATPAAPTLITNFAGTIGLGGGESTFIFDVNASQVPEPSSALLLGFASLGLLAKRRRA